ncbi:MAG: methyl-accepting chemotaxis protein [Alphaproteobacteria bacterium]|nr:methyl-accepting chemotaxis protein [Alphaproteobacteria bacterium]MBO6626948.1 methyl-accepting chemotaxis protein [Alphaproteobacteria bacterium]MDF1627715.1 methyl-accepting chemotaxis protein [Parvibaculaceae bacterium]
MIGRNNEGDADRASSDDEARIGFWNSLGSRFVLNGALTVFLVVSLAGLGLWSSNHLSNALTQSENVSGALENHLTANAMLQAMKGDALASIQAGIWGVPTDQDAAEADLVRHIGIFEEAVLANQAIDLPEDVRVVLGNVDEPLKAYVATARRIVELASANYGAAQTMMPSFTQEFLRLEEVMNEVAVTIEESLSTANAASESAASLAQMAMIVGLVLGLIFAVAVNFMTASAVVRPLTAMTDAMRKLAGGDLDLSIPSEGRADEMGAMASAVATFKENAIARVRLEEAQRAEEEKRAGRTATLERLMAEFDKSVSNVISVLVGRTGDLTETANRMNEVSRRTNEKAGVVASEAKSSQSSSQSIASATAELTASVGEISRQVSHAAKASGQAVDQAEQTNKTVASMADAANKIGEVVKLISDVAEQTNLLALNATIEAARAGEAGKGFAVVASEVKALANQTAKATEEITTQIQAIQTVSQASVTAIGEICEKIRDLDEINASVASALEEQDGANREISQGAEHASEGANRIAANIEEVAAATHETEEVGAAVLSVSGELGDQSNVLKKLVDDFVRGIKAA